MWVLLLWVIVAAGVLVKWHRSGEDLIPFMGLRAISAYARLWHGMQRRGTFRIPSSQPVILVANHTCSTDAGLISACCDRPISFLMAAEYYKIPLLNRLLTYMHCVPVQRNGQDTAAVRHVLRLLKNRHVLCIFPEGGLSNAGRSQPRRGKCGAAYFALKSRVPVIPVLIRGGPQTSDIGKAWLGTSRARITFGEPVNLERYYGQPMDRRLLEQVTDELMKRVVALDKLSAPGESLTRGVACPRGPRTLDYRSTL
jgi:1-acyl-sn-glycerol-3-phosphate acyltransferase